MKHSTLGRELLREILEAPQFEIVPIVDEKYYVAREPLRFKIVETTGYEKWKEEVIDDIQWFANPSTDIMISGESQKQLQMVAICEQAGSYKIEAKVNWKGREIITAVLKAPLEIEDRVIEITYDAKVPRAKSRIQFEVRLTSPTQSEEPFKNFTQYAWTFSDDPKNPVTKTDSDIERFFDEPGEKTITVALSNSFTEQATLQLGIEESALTLANKKYKDQQSRSRIIGYVIGVLGGWIAVAAFGETFGSLKDYIVAFLWGAGVNATLTGVGPITSHVAKIFPAKTKKSE